VNSFTLRKRRFVRDQLRLDALPRDIGANDRDVPSSRGVASPVIALSMLAEMD
jgi:hypothetical protein